MASKIKSEVVLITPKKAMDLLEKQHENRNISSRHVTALAESIKRGQWYTTNQGIALDGKGRLLDGEHRLRAIIEAGKSARILVVTGVMKEARPAIDRGRARTVADELRMRGYSSTNNLAAYVSLCANLIAGTRVQIKTYESWLDWYSLVKRGIDWSIETFCGDRILRTTAVTGSLAFAYKADPEAIEVFGMDVLSGISLKEKDPALVYQKWLNRFMLTTPKGGRSIVQHTKGSRRDYIVRKTLQAAFSAIKSKKLQRLQDGEEGLNYFHKSYSAGKARELAKPWIESRLRDLQDRLHGARKLENE